VNARQFFPRPDTSDPRESISEVRSAGRLSRRSMMTVAGASVGAIGLWGLVDGSAAAKTTEAETLLVAHRGAHELWNKRDLESFIPTFFDPIHYLEVPSGHEITNASEMIEFASKWFEMAPDAKLSGVYWYAGINGDELGKRPVAANPALEKDTWTVSMITLAGTNTGPLPEGKEPTNKPFSLQLTEWISWRKIPPASESVAPPWKATGGGMYFDSISLAKQLGLPEPPALPIPI